MRKTRAMRRPAWVESVGASWSSFPRPIRRILAASVGVVTLVVGAALLVLPGPGIAVVLLGLAILATEFTWAKRSMHHVKQQSSKVTRSVIRSRDSITSKKGQKNDE